MFTSKLWPWLAFASLWSLAGGMACFLDGFPGGERAASTTARIFGKCVSSLADSAYERADMAYHLGRPAYEERAFSNDVFQTWRSEIAPGAHAHLEGKDKMEILSWLKISLALNPGDVERYLVAAFWLLDRTIARPAEAEKLLIAARQANPDAYLPYLGLGRLYTKTDEREKAMRCFDRGIMLWPGGLSRTNDEARLDKRELLSRRAILREMNGDAPGAITDMKDILSLYPELRLPQFRERIVSLQSGRQPVESAAQRWSALMAADYRHACQRGSDDEHEGHEH